MAPVTHILDILEAAAASKPEIGISFLEEGFNAKPTYISYRDLYEKAHEKAKLLVQADVVRPGSITIIYFDNHRDNVTWFWSIIAAGGVCAILNPVSNDPKTVSGQLENLKSLFGSTRVLTSHKLSSIFTSHGLDVETVEQVEKPRGASNRKVEIQADHELEKEGRAVILFTSGSTGHSKAVCYTHAQLVASVRAKVDYLGTYGKTFMNWTCKCFMMKNGRLGQTLT
nr:nonribosomal peptide synthetase pnga [Quercus suber]